jgi:hypothetical protein
MKILDIPATVTVKPVGGQGEPRQLPFREFCLTHIDTYAEIKMTGQIRQIAKIAAALEGDAATFQLEDAEYELLKAACGAPKFLPGVCRQVVSYYDALDKAQDVKK